jgi:peptidoglycan/xylan/chitin deacetylase (PgdA/CDA1 family)
MDDDVWSQLRAELDKWPSDHAPARFWLRDDDAIEPTAALDRLLAVAAGTHLALAVVPQPSGRALASILKGSPGVTVVTHGWAHRNHAPDGEKKQEFGAHRPSDIVLAELHAGRDKLRELHKERFLPVFVPPWNRIDPTVAARLPETGYRAISTFGNRSFRAVPAINSTVDIMDWHGYRGGRDHTVLIVEVIRQLRENASMGRGAVGILSHHLAHDEIAWAFLAGLLETTRNHPNCRWCALSDLL